MTLLSLRTLVSLILITTCGCAHAQPARPIARAILEPPASRPAPASQPASRGAPAGSGDRLAELRRLVEAELAAPEMASVRVSLLVVPLAGRKGPASRPASPASQPASQESLAARPILEIAADVRRLPASNAKLLTTLGAALLLPGKYRFVTEVSRLAGRGALYLWGTGDPILRRTDLLRLANQVKAQGAHEIRGIVVDDSHFGRERLAPGFEAFAEGSFYRPTSGAINVDGNAIEIRVSAPADRKRPRVDVTPPSDYVVVRKLVRYSTARRVPEASKADVQIRMEPRGSLLHLIISGTMGRKAPPFVTRRAVHDPSLNAGWALYRALALAGVRVTGAVRRGRRPAGARLLARREHGLGEVLAAANQHSDNLAAETLVRVMSFLPDAAPAGEGRRVAAASWRRGLVLLRSTLKGVGLSSFELGNGSGLHRRTWVTARLLVQLLQTVYSTPALRSLLVPTLAVAGKSGTLAPRLRGGGAEGHLLAKTGTLGGALALSGYVDLEGKQPLCFSLLTNGRSDRLVRDRMDRIAEVVARYARGLPLSPPPSRPAEETPASRPAEETSVEGQGS